MTDRTIKLGIQAFNLAAGGDWEKVSSMDDVNTLLETIKGAGFDGIEWCNFMLNEPFMDLQRLKEQMDALGLQTCGMHFHYQSKDTLEKDCKEAVERCKLFACSYLIFAYSTPETFGIEGEKKEAEHPHQDPKPEYTPEHIGAWAEETDKVLAVMKAACEGSGIRVLYHNHADEMRKCPNGRFFFDAIAAEGQEVDVYWVAKGLDGKVATALDYVEERRAYVKLLHIKDGLNGSIFPNEMCGWGKGTYPIQAEIDCAKKLGLSWVVYENDAPKNFGTSGLEDAVQTGEYVKQNIVL